MMDIANLNLEQLRTLYYQKTNKLSKALLSGKDWNELKEQREEVTALGITLHKRLATMGTVKPADFQVNFKNTQSDEDVAA